MSATHWQKRLSIALGLGFLLCAVAPAGAATNEPWTIDFRYAPPSWQTAICLPDDWQKNIDDVCRRAYRALDLDSYVRFDIRVTGAGEVYIIEPNANPCIAKIYEMAQAALKAGISYEDLIQKILDLGLLRHDHQ